MFSRSEIALRIDLKNHIGFVLVADTPVRIVAIRIQIRDRLGGMQIPVPVGRSRQAGVRDRQARPAQRRPCARQEPSRARRGVGHELFQDPATGLLLASYDFDDAGHRYARAADHLGSVARVEMV